MPLQAESSVSNDICATKEQIGRPSTNQAISIGCHNNHHVYVTLLMQNLCTVWYDITKRVSKILHFHYCTINTASERIN